eukprot:c6552_g1_i1 orf=95-337(+)
MGFLGKSCSLFAALSVLQQQESLFHRDFSGYGNHCLSQLCSIDVLLQFFWVLLFDGWLLTVLGISLPNWNCSRSNDDVTD